MPTILNELEKAFPDCWFKPGADFGGGGAAVWSGEGSEIAGLSAFNPNGWESDPEEKTWTMGVHNRLVSFAGDRGYFWQTHDAGTYLLYKV